MVSQKRSKGITSILCAGQVLLLNVCLANPTLTSETPPNKPLEQHNKQVNTQIVDVETRSQPSLTEQVSPKIANEVAPQQPEAKIDETPVAVGSKVVTSMDATTMVFSLLLVLLLIGLIALILKRFNISPLSQGGAINVIASHHLGGKEKVVVIDVNGEQLLLGVTANQVNLLKKLEQPITAEKPEMPAGIANILKLKK